MANILKHEFEWLQHKMTEGEAKNFTAAADMANAIENGNVWHDNAEYDEVRDRMKQIDATYKPFMFTLANAIVVEYPEPTDEVVSIGSLVKLTDPHGTYSALIVGIASLGLDLYEEMWQKDGNSDDLLVLGAEAPMASALIGRVVGDLAVWNVGKDEHSTSVLELDNGWLSSLMSQQVPVHELDTALADFTE